jgi:hypothetical protein
MTLNTPTCHMREMTKEITALGDTIYTCEACGFTEYATPDDADIYLPDVDGETEVLPAASNPFDMDDLPF